MSARKRRSGGSKARRAIRQNKVKEAVVHPGVETGQYKPLSEHDINQIHHTAIACGAYIMNNVEKDYAWNKYADANKRIADRNGLQQTNSCHVLKDEDNQLWGIGQLVAGA